MKRARHRHIPAKGLVAVLIIALFLLIGIAKFHRSHTSGSSRQTDATTASSPSHAPSSPHSDARLQHIIDVWASEHSFDSTVVATELTGGLRTADRGRDTTMVTASTYKIYVAYAALHEVEQGKLTLGTITRTGQTVEQALDKMILQSDNDSAEALGFRIGWDTIDAYAANAGAVHTDINNYDSAGNPTVGDKQSTAGDLAIMLTKLQKGTLLNAGHTQTLLDLMKSQVWRERVPAGVPSGIAVADKPGWLDDVENDAAIVYGPKSTYILVVMTNGSTTQPLADLSSLIYQYLEM